jgi:DNA polymerase
VYVYAEDSTTDIWCAGYAFDDEEPAIWTPGQPVPARIIKHILAGGKIVAHNAQFERVIMHYIATPRYGWPEPKLEQWVCTASMAAAMALPRHLDSLAKALGVHQLKDDEGHRLMLRMARPRRVESDGKLVWWDLADRKQRLFDYCKQDVRTERAVEKAMRPLGAHETEIYRLDQRINDRGVQIDLQLVHAAQRIVEEGVRRANAELSNLTGGQVTAVTNHGRLLAWLNENDTATESVSKAAIAALRERTDLAPDVAKVLELRSEAGRSSVAKLKTMQSAASNDGRARGLLMYHGASTGRWTGKSIQPQNFPRGEIDNPEWFIPLIRAGDYDAIAEHAPPILVVLSLLRAMLVAPVGATLYGGDFSAIEARVLAWLAGQDDLLFQFGQYDAAPKGEKDKFDPYRRAAADCYGIPLDQVLKFPHRQTGKFQILGCGYGMGAKKAVSAAKAVYQLDLTPEDAERIVKQYRAKNKAIVNFWHETERACIEAVLHPGSVQRFGARKNLVAIQRGSYLYIILPSGRPLCYAAPSIEDVMTPWGEMKSALHFSAVNSFSKQWGRQSAYGGLLVENIVQAVSRDLLADALLRVESHGYLPVLSVHDEIVAQAEAKFGSEQEFERLMTALPPWAVGCPVAAETWTGSRYGK